MSASSEIATKVLKRLEQVRKSGGFETDIGANVFWGASNVPGDLLQFCVLIEGEDQVLQQKDDGVAQIRMPYEIEAQAKCDPKRPNEMGHSLVADIKRAIFGPGLNIKGATQTHQILYAGRVIQPRQDASDRVVARVMIQITFPESLTAP